MKHFTFLYPKKLNIRNNVKNAMIQEFLYSLHNAIDNYEERGSVMLSSYTMPKIILYLSKNDRELSQVQSEDIPCMNVDCEWIKHMLLFYPSRELFSLPATSPSGYCKICNLYNEKQLNAHEIVLSRDNCVYLKKKY